MLELYINQVRRQTFDAVYRGYSNQSNNFDQKFRLR